MSRYQAYCTTWIAFLTVLPSLQAVEFPRDPYPIVGPQVGDELESLQTIAERSDYTETADEQQVAEYLRELATAWPTAELTDLGTTVEERKIWALVVEPQQARMEHPLTVLLLGGIHPGECDGKEALLALARDLACGQHRDDWQSLRLIFVPNYNVDGNERRSRAHRPGQAGPVQGMGVRENAQGLDLNRDFMKLDSPEARGLVGALTEYDVDVLIDTHTTNGSLHQYVLTYDIPHNPSAPKAIDAYLRETYLPAITERLDEQGLPTTYYGNFDAPHSRWTTYGHEPRYSTEYMGLRGKIGILSESYSYVSYRQRVEASYAFVLENLRKLSQDQYRVRGLLDEAAATPQPGDSVCLAAELVKTASEVELAGYQLPSGGRPRPPYGPEAFGRHERRTYSVELWNRAQSTADAKLPEAYVIPADNAWAVSRLRFHGVELKRLAAKVDAPVERYVVESAQANRTFQRHTMRDVSVRMEQATATLPAGAYVVETRQPLGRLAAHLLEPAADDSLATWNFFDPDLVVGEHYPVLRVQASLPNDALQAVNAVERGQALTLEHLFTPDKQVEYGGERLQGAKWLKGTDEYVVATGGRTYAVEASTGARRRLSELDSLVAKLAEREGFEAEQARAAVNLDAFTDDWRFALLSHKKDLYFYDAGLDVVRQLTSSPNAEERLPELSPTGDRVAFVRENDLWLVDTRSGKEVRLTDNGSEDQLNGVLDWVYQEELYGRGNFKAFWWSPDGARLAFLRLDQTPVPSYQVSDSTTFAQSLEATRYPKAGQALPHVEVWTATLAGDLEQVDLSEFPAEDRLIGRVSWSPDGQLWLQVLNRVQNQQTLLRTDGQGSACQQILVEHSPGWIELRGTPQHLDNGEFLWLSDLPQGRTHLFKVAADGSRQQLTRGQWDVSALLSVSADGQTAFVTGNLAEATGEQLVRVDIASGDCQQISQRAGTHAVQLNAAGTFYIDQFSSQSDPPRVALHRIDGALQRVIEAPISDRHRYLQISSRHRFTIEARDGVELQAELLLPAGWDTREQDLRLPVLFYVYGGPQAPTIRDSWAGRNYWWHQYLCQQGMAVLLCDNRASRGRGVKDTWTIRGDLCRVELQDLEDAAAWVRQQPWADPQRLGVWGWSYGGYFTAYALTHSQTFACGIAGAPVTDWRNYDAIYTERYMDLPQANKAGYSSSSVVEAASQLQGKLLLIHGERDDNVHISNSLQLVNALQEAGKQFEFMVYPKNRHGITDPEQRDHMYRMMTTFLLRNLAPVLPTGE